MLVKIDGELMLVNLSFIFYILAFTEAWYHLLSLRINFRIQFIF